MGPDSETKHFQRMLNGDSGLIWWVISLFQRRCLRARDLSVFQYAAFYCRVIIFESS